ncbi:MAG: SRPBCC domain-containing protein [Luteolibacter sp.]|uniref:SRPBCC domain-containing protein n=1 Tax=Luteolibacter sp. TaxID=1962973 RepID=UPI003262EEB3
MLRYLLPIQLIAATTFAAEPAMKPEFNYTLFIAKPAQDVWNALTRKEMIDRYYMAPLATLELKKGGKIAYGTKDSELISGIITEIDEPKKLSHTFHFAGSEDPDTTVTYEIKAIGDAMCSLRITHSGFAIENQTYADISGGWPGIASSLKTVLETGKPLPWPKK